MGRRRVVTGVRDGVSVVVSDEVVETTAPALMGGATIDLMWSSAAPATVPHDGRETPAPGYFPPPGGFRMMVFTMPPDAAVAPVAPDAAAIAEMQERLPGILGVMEPDGSGMHTSDTVDMALVLSGRGVFEVDDGAMVELGPGEVMVNCGTRHAWRNHGDEPCVLVAFLAGAGRV